MQNKHKNLRNAVAVACLVSRDIKTTTPSYDLRLCERCATEVATFASPSFPISGICQRCLTPFERRPLTYTATQQDVNELGRTGLEGVNIVRFKQLAFAKNARDLDFSAYASFVLDMWRTRLNAYRDAFADDRFSLSPSFVILAEEATGLRLDLHANRAENAATLYQVTIDAASDFGLVGLAARLMRSQNSMDSCLVRCHRMAVVNRDRSIQNLFFDGQPVTNLRQFLKLRYATLSPREFRSLYQRVYRRVKNGDTLQSVMTDIEGL